MTDDPAPQRACNRLGFAIDCDPACITSCVAPTPPRCYRHKWQERADGWNEPYTSCTRCGKHRDEAVVKRNRRNRQRGGAYELAVAKRLGGRKTGPLGGRDDVIVGEMFAAQTKRALRFSLAEARTYLADLRRTFPTRTPMVVHAFPGERGGGVVVVTLNDWVLWHGPDTTTDTEATHD